MRYSHAVRPQTTMADIARLAGVSTSAVSLALNGRTGVSPDTRERITKIAEELGWYPNVAARALTGRPVAAVGIVLSRPARFLGAEPFFMSFLAGLEAQLSKVGSSLLMHIAESSAEEIFVMRSRVSGDTPVRPLRASDTALVDTPAKRAMSAMVVCGRTA